MGKTILTRLIVASLLSLWPDQLINFRELEDGTAIAVTPTGQKYTFTPEQLIAKEQQLIALETTKRRPSTIAGPNPILDKVMETKPRPSKAEPVSKKVETDARAISGDPVTKKVETEKRLAIAKPVTKKKAKAKQ